MSVTLYETGLVALLDAPTSPVTRNVTAKAEAVAEQARQNVQAEFRTRTGNLERSIGVFPSEGPNGVEFEVGTQGAPYGLVLEKGSPPHEIFAHNSPYLWSLSQDPNHPDPLIFSTASVDHPGTYPRPWLEPALVRVFTGG